MYGVSAPLVSGTKVSKSLLEPLRTRIIFGIEDAESVFYTQTWFSCPRVADLQDPRMDRSRFSTYHIGSFDAAVLAWQSFQ